MPGPREVWSWGAWSVGGSGPGGVPGPGGSGPGGVPCGDLPDGYCCGLYASYWNAFLLILCNLSNS